MRKIIISLTTAVMALILLAITHVSALPAFETAAVNSCVRGTAIAAFSAGMLEPVTENSLNTANLDNPDAVPKYSQLISVLSSEFENDILTTESFTVMTYSSSDTIMLSASLLLPLGSDSPERVSVYTRILKSGTWALQKLTVHIAANNNIIIDLVSHPTILIFDYLYDGNGSNGTSVIPSACEPETTMPYTHPFIPPFIVPTQTVTQPISKVAVPSKSTAAQPSFDVTHDISLITDTGLTTSPVTGEPVDYRQTNLEK